MAMLMKQDEERSELQRRLAAELQGKLRSSSLEGDPTDTNTGKTPDGVADSDYVKDKKSTTSLAGVWMAIVLAIIVLSVWILIR